MVSNTLADTVYTYHIHMQNKTYETELKINMSLNACIYDSSYKLLSEILKTMINFVVV